MDGETSSHFFPNLPSHYTKSSVSYVDYDFKWPVYLSLSSAWQRHKNDIIQKLRVEENWAAWTHREDNLDMDGPL